MTVIGRIAAAQLAPEGSHSLERSLLSVALGAGVVMGVVFVLASIGLLGSALLQILTLAAVLGSVPRLLRLVGRANFQGPCQGGELGAAGWLMIAAATPVLGAMFLHAMRPDVVWDSNVYHLTLPRLYLENGGFHRIPLNVYSNWPLNTQLLYTWAMGILDYVSAKTLHFAFGCLAALAAWLLASGKSSRASFCGPLAALLFLANDVVLLEIRIAYVDLAFAFFTALAVWALCTALDGPESERRRTLLLCGVLAGLVAGIKLNGFFVALALCGTLALDALGHETRRRPREVLGDAITIALPALALLAPWLLKSWLLTGNPVYPLLFELFGGPEWSAELAHQHTIWQRSIGMGRSAIDYLLLPLRVILFGDRGYEHFDGAIHRAWIVLLPMAIASSVRDLSTRRYLLVSLLYFGLWAATSQQTRLLIPILPLLAAASARSLGRAFELLPTRARSLARFTVASAVIVMLALTTRPYLGGTLRLVRDMFAHGAEMKQAVIRPVYRFIDEQLPEDAKLLLVNNNYGFFVERDFLADSFFEASQVEWLLSSQATPEEAASTLSDLGVTHLLVENRELGLRFSPGLVELLSDPARARVIYRSPEGRFQVVALE